jgi:hypothetical protein
VPCLGSSTRSQSRLDPRERTDPTAGTPDNGAITWASLASPTVSEAHVLEIACWSNAEVPLPVAGSSASVPILTTRFGGCSTSRSTRFASPSAVKACAAKCVTLQHPGSHRDGLGRSVRTCIVPLEGSKSSPTVHMGATLPRREDHRELFRKLKSGPFKRVVRHVGSVVLFGISSCPVFRSSDRHPAWK